jgi:mono/diheme cytochrome c family protein
MPRFARILLIAVGAVLGAFVVAVLILSVVGGKKIERRFAVPLESVTLATDSADLAEGERLSAVLGCDECHGANLAGSLLIDAPVFAVLPATNLTTGEGGVGAAYTAADFERAVRHGIDREGRPLMIMPSRDFSHLTDQDVGRVIGYVMRVPPVDNPLGPRQIGLMGKIITSFAAAGLFPAYAIDQAAPHVTSVSPTVSAEYGEYLARPCTGCHGLDYAGGRIPGGGPDAPPAGNLTPDPTAGIGSWTEAEFVRAMREGTRPDGSAIDTAMPWEAFSRFTDDELGALWLFLRSLRAIPGDT